ncbi:MAG: 23S rRNA (adenine(2503)-C(2))-methyltransferase RlmN [Nitrospiraceae bacterium]|nr:23S rRNA (adenine(2503)-C(2))-methyltransferase RlmN [Nitrospiraceae bacterium]
MGRVKNLKSLDRAGLEAFFRQEGLPAFRARQAIHWIYEKNVRDISEITEFAKPLRDSLSQKAYISNLALKERQVSADGTEKYLFGLEDGNSIESVLIPDEKRLTLCVSSQVGCALSCRFCLTGKLGMIRDLRAHEIVDQYLSARRLAAPRKITNMVFMGMGEPLNNLENVASALKRLTELAHFSRRRITVSTSGIAPKILELPERAPLVNLAVSLNASTDEVRDRIMPINRRYNLEALFEALRRFPLPPRSRITFEYVMLSGVNDTDADARRAAALLRGIPSKINLIPFNEHEGSIFRTPSDKRALAFRKILTDAGYTAIIRKSKGRDILAACGQLKAKY